MAVLCHFESPALAVAPGVQIRSVAGEFDDIKERLVLALENRGLVISYTAHVGDMLDRTGRDLGQQRPLYGKAEVIEFCSATLSRNTMQADPVNIVYCPYGIAIYTLPDVPGRVFLAYRTMAESATPRSAPALQAIQRLLAELVGEAMH